MKLNDQQAHLYKKGDIIEVPKGVTMELVNAGDTSLEFFAIKAPSPTYK